MDLTKPRTASVHRVAMAHPGDTSGIGRLFDDGLVKPEEVVAVFGKTEGNGCVNDFTRGYAVLAIETLFSERLACPRGDVGRRLAIVISGGTEGGLSPHFIVFAVRASDTPAEGKALAVGVAFTRAFRPEEIGRMGQVEETRASVLDAMRQAGIADASDVHFVQMKCPLLTSAKIADATARGFSVATEDTYASMGSSRGASALGAALALGEIEAGRVTDAAIGRDLSLWSARASASSGVELDRTEVIVLGNSPDWSGDCVIAHAIMRDAIDLPSIQAVLRALDFDADGQIGAADAGRVAAVLAKADPPRGGRIRGARHIMWDDSDVHATRHARALVGGVVAAAVGRTDLFVSGGAEHQGPDGGGPIAIIARRPIKSLSLK